MSIFELGELRSYYPCRFLMLVFCFAVFVFLGWLYVMVVFIALS